MYSQLSSRRRPLERALSTRPGGEFPCISHRAGILRRFGLKTGIHFPHFGLELGMVFEGTTGVCFRSNLSSDNIKARSENEYGF